MIDYLSYELDSSLLSCGSRQNVSKKLRRNWGLESSFDRDCPRKQDIVLQMNVLMQVPFKLGQRPVKSLIADASVWRRHIARARGFHRSQRSSRRIVLMFHHRDGILHGSKGRRQQWLLGDRRIFHARNVGEQYYLFLQHVSG